MTDLAACTIVAKREIAAARVLADSFRRLHASCRVFVLLADRIDGYFAPDREPFELIQLSDLGIRDLARLCFTYCLPELRAVVQPHLLRHLLLDRGVSKVFYLGRGILALRELEELASLLDQHSLLLTPHLTEVEQVAQEEREEQALLRAGVYSLAFMGFRNDARAQRVLDWWSRRVSAVRVTDEQAELVEQPWMAVVPALFEGVGVVHGPGYLVSAQSLPEGKVEVHADAVFIEGRPGCWVRIDEPEEDRLPSATGSIGERCQQLLIHAGYAETREWPYAFAKFDNGVPIPLEARRLYRELGEGAAQLGDPFETGQARCFWEWLKQDVQPGSGVSRFWYRVYVSRPDLRRVFPDVLAVDRLGYLSWIREHGRAECAVGEAFERTDERRPASSVRSPARPGLNLVGYAMSEKGLGEALRATARALTAAEIPYCAVDFPDPGSANRDRTLVGILEHNPYPINVIHVTADLLPHFVGARGTGFLRGKYNIGFWMWELPEFPPLYHGSFAYVDEVWVASTYCLETISRVAPVPVVKIPLALPAEGLRTKEVGRDHFGLSEGSVVFLFIFDVHSTLARKNPRGVIHAFKRAFKGDKDVRLVLKLVHGDWRIRRELRRQAEDDRVIVMDRVLERTELNSLIEVSDCYVSLHRSEGFGLTMAEAMALGKPVIATAYSANVDFMTPTNSLLVRYDLVRLEEDYLPYRRGSIWAEPDVDHAAELMRWVYENPEAARRIGARASDDIWQYLAPPAVARHIENRLELVARRLAAGEFGRPVGR